jgi:reactive chlorine resistance protein C
MQLPGLASAGFSVTRCGLATCFLWIGALKFKDYEAEDAEPLVTASPLTSRLREKLGAQKRSRDSSGSRKSPWAL